MIPQEHLWMRQYGVSSRLSRYTGDRRKTSLRRDNTEHRGRMLAHGTPNRAERLPCLPTPPEFSLLFVRQARATGSCHRGSFQNISKQ